MEVLDRLFSHLGVLVLGHLPGRFHHAHEVLIRGRAHGQVGIVVIELLPGYDAIVVAAGSVEVIEELGENLILRLSPFEELCIHGYIIDTGNVAHSQLARAVFVKHLEGLPYHGNTSLGQFVSQSREELVIGDVAILVDVVKLHESLYLDLLGEDSEGGQSLFKLRRVEFLVAVEVHLVEDALQ